MNASLYTRLATSLAVAVGIFFLATSPTFFGGTLASLFFAVVLLSVFPILLRTRARLWEAGGTLMVAAALWALDIHFLGYPPSWAIAASFLGLASLLFLTLRVIWREDQARREAMYILAASFLFSASEWCASYFLAWTARVHPKVLDLYLYAFDATLHVQLSFWLGQIFTHSTTFTLTSFFVYLGLPVAIGMTFAGCMMRDRNNALPAFLAMLLAGPVGVIFYNLFPALGPVHLFADRFPWHPPTTTSSAGSFSSPWLSLATGMPFLLCTPRGCIWSVGMRGASLFSKRPRPCSSCFLRCATPWVPENTISSI
jgi:hypothetical protein